MGRNLASEVIEAVADAKGIDPVELDIVLADYINPDALDQLAQHDSGTWTLSFELPEHNVTVTSDGLILVDGQREVIWA